MESRAGNENSSEFRAVQPTTNAVRESPTRFLHCTHIGIAAKYEKAPPESAAETDNVSAHSKARCVHSGGVD